MKTNKLFIFGLVLLFLSNPAVEQTLECFIRQMEITLAKFRLYFNSKSELTDSLFEYIVNFMNLSLFTLTFSSFNFWYEVFKSKPSKRMLYNIFSKNKFLSYNENYELFLNQINKCNRGVMIDRFSILKKIIKFALSSDAKCSHIIILSYFYHYKTYEYIESFLEAIKKESL